METKPLGKPEVLGVVQELYQKYVDQQGKLPRMLIAVGGTAMALHGLRKLSEDADLYCIEDAFLPLAMELEKETGYRIDVTNKTTLFGALNIPDVEADAQVLEKVPVIHEGQTFLVDIAAISPETLFCIKGNTLREKDRDDLPAILSVTTPNAVFRRLDALLQHLDKWEGQDVLFNLVDEMQIVTLEVPQKEWFDGCHFIEKRYARALEEKCAFVSGEGFLDEEEDSPSC